MLDCNAKQLFLEAVDAGHLDDFLNFHQVLDDLLEGLRIMDIEHDGTFSHPL